LQDTLDLFIFLKIFILKTKIKRIMDFQDSPSIFTYSSYSLSVLMIIGVVVLVVLYINATKASSQSQSQVLADQAIVASQNQQSAAQIAELTAKNQQIAAQAAADKAASDLIIAQKNQAIAAQVAAAAAVMAPATTTPTPTTPTVTYQRPTVSDKGYSDRTSGWYDAQGLGACYDFCRYVGDYGSNWFSCVLADLKGTVNSPNSYTDLGVYTEAGLASKKCAN
jgi:hypothetical protein